MNATRPSATRPSATRRTGLLLALGTACISGLAVFLNSYGVKAFGDASTYTTAKNVVAALVLVLLTVLGVYPFVGLLRNGVVTEPLHVLDRCRIRWGRVVAVTGDHAVVQSRPLEWDGRHLVLGAVRDEVAVTGEGTMHLTRALAPGDWCSLHWDWVCDRLEPAQVRALQHYTETQLTAVNDAPATVLA